MKPEAFAKLPLTDDGRPIVCLMTDPEGPGSFVSLVDRGANGRRVAARKGLEVIDASPALPPAGALQDAGTVRLDLGQGNRENQNWFLDLFRGIFGRSEGAVKGLPQLTQKDDEAKTFSQTLGPALVRDELWRYQDALREALASALCDATVTDKRAAWALSLGQFTAAMLQLVDKVPTEKRDETAVSIRQEPVAKVGRVISAATLAIIQQALDADEKLRAALEALVAAGTPAAKAAEEDDVKLDATTLAALADQAGNNAIKVAKSLGVTDAAKLQEAYMGASERVVKAAVGGPEQPAIPTTELQRQQAQSGGLDGSPGNPLAKFEAVIEGLGRKVTKMDESLHGVAEEKDAAGKVVKAATPGIVDVLNSHSAAIGGISERVAKSLSIPAAPAGEEAAPTPEQVQKGHVPKPVSGAFTFTGR